MDVGASGGVYADGVCRDCCEWMSVIQVVFVQVVVVLTV